MLRGIPDFLRVFTLPTCTGNIKGLTWPFNCSLQLLIAIVIMYLLGRLEKLKPTGEIICFISLDCAITTLR